MKKSVGVILMLDESGSMCDAMSQVRIDANAFLGQSITGDQFAVNAFSDNARWIYPKSGADPIIKVEDDRREVINSSAAINEFVPFYGGTNITKAIRLSNSMIEKATTDIKAFVLLSDGAHNYGSPEPHTVLGNEPPLFIAGLGEYCKESYFVEMYNKNNKSKFYYKPHSFEMMLMFNQIRADTVNAALVVNELHTVTAGSYYTLDDFSVGSDAHTLVSVTWPDNSYIYTPGMAHDNQIFTALIDPDGKRILTQPIVAGGGYCIFELKNAKPGSWRVLTEYSTSRDFKTTVGVVDRNPSVRTSLKAPPVSKVGEPITVDVTLEGETADNVLIGMKITKHETISDNRATNHQLQSEEKPAGFTVKSYTTKRLLGDVQDGQKTVTIDNTSTPGIYDVEIEVEGRTPHTGLSFTQKKTVTIVVE